MLTTIANLRNTTEFRIANDYTYPQALHIAETYVKDRMLVVRQVAKAFGGGRSGEGTPKADEGRREAPKEPQTPYRSSGTDSRGLYPWYDPPYRTDRHGRKRKTIHKVVSLDGPMKTLAPYVGKGKIKRGGMKVSGEHRAKKVDARVRERKKRK